MKVFIESVIDPANLFDTDSADPVGEGGEAEVFKIPGSCLVNPGGEEPLVKIYDRKNISREKLIARQNKGILLVNQYSRFSEKFDTQSGFNASLYAFPQKNAMDYEAKTYAGFSMHDLGRWSTLEDFMFQDGKITNVITGYVMSDDEAAELFLNMTYGVFMLHRQGIILGDLNERNILYDTDRKLPLFLDIDSAQVDDFVCDAYTPEFLDPLIGRRRLDGSEDKREGSYEYSSGTDIFALAVNIYKLMTGFYPSDILGRNKPGDTGELTKRKIFLLRLLHDRKFLQQTGIELLDNSEHEQRLLQIQKTQPALYQHFVDVFVNDQRSYFTETLPLSDYRNPDFGDISGDSEDFDYENVPELETEPAPVTKNKRIGGFNLGKWLNPAFELKLHYSNSMGDSDAFRAFVGSLGYDYSALISGVFNERLCAALYISCGQSDSSAFQHRRTYTARPE